MTAARRALGWLAALGAALALSGCGYNQFQTLDEAVKGSWAEVLNQYQRRADLIPNVVATVKGEANFEQETLTKVVEARAKATSIQATPELINNPEAFNKFQQAQGELSSALSRLLVVSVGGHREPHHRGAQPLHQVGGRLQRAGTPVPDQPHRDDLRLCRQAELHGAERGADQRAAGGELRQAGFEVSTT
jgi:hypothetical protein